MFTKHSAPALTTLSDSDLAPVKGGWCKHGGGRKHGGYGGGGYKDHGGRGGRGGGSSDSFSSSNAAANAQNETNVTTNVVINFDPLIVR